MGDIHHEALIPCDRRGVTGKAVARCHVGKGKGLQLAEGAWQRGNRAICTDACPESTTISP